MTATPHHLGRDLYRLAHEIDYVHAHLPDVQSAGGVPQLKTVARHLDELNRLASDALGGAMTGLAESSHSSDAEHRAITAFTSAAADIGRAVSHLSGTFHLLAQGNQPTGHPETEDHPYIRASATPRAAVQELQSTRAALDGTGAKLRAEADQLLDLPRETRTQAARARSQLQPQSRPAVEPRNPPPPISSPLPRRHR